MSYRALLFCPDETAARLVTQVLSELDFTVELSFDPFVTVKKLTAEPFDAVVVDCGNEENASLLFKSARNSSLNHSSLCVAVVEGQMGVAKAFRIGANLVLTKPINIEQSKGTLRVARGLLRKSEPKPRAASQPAETVRQTPAPVPSSVAGLPAPATAANISAPASSVEQPAPARAAAVPSSLFEAEQEKPAAHDADEKKPRESMPDFLISKPVAAEQSLAPPPKAGGDRFAGGNSSTAAAAPALAPELPKPRTNEFLAKTAQPIKTVQPIKTAPPLASQDAIAPQRRFPEPPAVRVPTFSSYAQPSSRKSGGGSKMFWVFVCMVILAPAGYFGWQKLQPMRYIHRPAPAPDTGAPAASPQVAADSDSTPVNSPAAAPQSDTSAVSSAPNSPDNNANTPNSTTAAPEGFPTKETIEVSQPMETPEPDITVVSKPKPMKVNQRPTVSAASQTPLAPPSIVLPGSETSDSTVAGIVSTKVVVPKTMPDMLQLSQGVSQGLLIKKIAPVYPPAALQLRKQGAVELMATISKTGTITKVSVLSGDAMLAKAALDAVRQWKYRPFLLNAEPVQIETQITINFRLPN
jgi:periplasmic protein TonB